MAIETKEYYLSVGELLDYIERHNIPRDGKVYYQRIEDLYFEDNGWSNSSVKVEGEQYHNALHRNHKVDNEYQDREQYPLMKDPEKYRISGEELEGLKEEYVSAFCAINYDKKNLYITAHY